MFVNFGIGSKNTALLKLSEKRSVYAFDSLICLLVMVIVLVADKTLHSVLGSHNNYEWQIL